MSDWEAAVTDEAVALQSVHQMDDELARMLRYFHRKRTEEGRFLGRFVSYDLGYQDGCTAAVTAYRDLLCTWPDLTDQEALDELRLGDRSLFWPMFKEDPTTTVWCFKGEHHTLVDKRGICDECGVEVG